MATLHGILAELGIENPSMHPEREALHQPQWIIDEEFVPIEGASYDITFGKILFHGEQRHVVKRIRVDGRAPDMWFDLGEGKPLDAELRTYAVKAFRSVR
jgi:hypothetical protein